MRAVFGVVSLLIVLAVVGWTARSALRAGGGASSAASAAAAPAASIRQPQQVQRDIDAALRQGRSRNDDAERQDAAPADPAGGRPGGGAR